MLKTLKNQTFFQRWAKSPHAEQKSSKGKAKKLVPRYVSQFTISRLWSTHVYGITRNGQTTVTVQHESRLKPFHQCLSRRGRAHALMEPALKPNMRGVVRRKLPKENTRQDEDHFDREPVLDSVLTGTGDVQLRMIVRINPRCLRLGIPLSWLRQPQGEYQNHCYMGTGTLV